MRINNNIGAINAHRNLYRNDLNLGKSLQKLSSGLRINSAADDAGGLGISETMRSQVRGLAQAEKNAQDGYGLMSVMDGALGQVHDMMQRLRELAVQAANGTLTTSDRANLTNEATQLTNEITRITSTGATAATTFNNQAVFGATFTLQVGPNNQATNQIATTSITVTNPTMTLTAAGAAGTISAVDTQIAAVSASRATIGGWMNRLENTIASLQTTRENMAAAESRIRDTDMASEMTTLTRNQILVQSSTAMLAQANARPQSVLALLQ